MPGFQQQHKRRHASLRQIKTRESKQRETTDSDPLFLLACACRESRAQVPSQTTTVGVDSLGSQGLGIWLRAVNQCKVDSILSLKLICKRDFLRPKSKEQIPQNF